MGIVRIIGGICALIGGILILIHLIIAIDMLIDGITTLDNNLVIAWVINCIVALFAIIGGILGLLSKRSGGSWALVVGLMALLLPIIASVIGDASNAPAFVQLSAIDHFTGIRLFTITTPIIMIVSIESLMIVVGGIIILISPSN